MKITVLLGASTKQHKFDLSEGYDMLDLIHDYILTLNDIEEDSTVLIICQQEDKK